LTPPVKVRLKAKKLVSLGNCLAALLPLKTITAGAPPAAAPAMTSAKPSPLTSPAATGTPPVKFGAWA